MVYLLLRNIEKIIFSSLGERTSELVPHLLEPNAPAEVVKLLGEVRVLWAPHTKVKLVCHRGESSAWVQWELHTRKLSDIYETIERHIREN